MIKKNQRALLSAIEIPEKLLNTQRMFVNWLKSWLNGNSNAHSDATSAEHLAFAASSRSGKY